MAALLDALMVAEVLAGLAPAPVGTPGGLEKGV